MSTSPDTRKPHCNSVLNGLPPEQKARLDDWLLDDNRGYEEIRELVAKEFGVETSLSGLSRYYRRWVAPRRIVEESEGLADWSTLDAEEIEYAAIIRARQLGLSALTERTPEFKTASKLLGLANKIERVRLARIRVDLAEWQTRIRDRSTPECMPLAQRIELAKAMAMSAGGQSPRVQAASRVETPQGGQSGTAAGGTAVPAPKAEKTEGPAL